ncbi:carboxypeptidase-like regulatory domain-containing protein [Bernardetia sp. OM2101]|uniref:carboxypeptidase-like regulatory domain-containing protein n=1 Tax=Bernardetia sp. OM2101 TaxID=3344876 RepID=UPI0035D08762
MKVNLPEPCHEDWNKMDSQERGRYCGSCQKLVIDFSVMSDTEIINYFKEYKGQNTCGHFKKTQIDRKLKKQETPRRKFFLKELAAACFAFFVASTEAKAQGESYFSEEEIAQTKKNQDKKTEIAINGKIVNGKESLSNASISIKGTEHKTVSLENGLFSMYIPFELAQNQKTVTLVVKYEGLESKEIEVTTSPTNQFVEVDFSENQQIYRYERIITGTIKDNTGETLPSATIQIKGTNQGTVSDIEGNYSLVVPYGSTLVFRFVGLDSKEIIVEEQTVIDVSLENGMLEGMFIVGGISSRPYRWYTPRNLWYKVKRIFR